MCFTFMPKLNSWATLLLNSECLILEWHSKYAQGAGIPIYLPWKVTEMCGISIKAHRWCFEIFCKYVPRLRWHCRFSCSIPNCHTDIFRWLVVQEVNTNVNWLIPLWTNTLWTHVSALNFRWELVYFFCCSVNIALDYTNLWDFVFFFEPSSIFPCVPVL